MSSTAPTTTVHPGHTPDPAAVARAITKRAFATLATSSPGGRPHVAGVLYGIADGHLFVSTLRASRKARNVAANPFVAVSIPVRRVPFGPPSQVHFQTTAEVLSPDDPAIRTLVAGGELAAVTGHGELDLPGNCFLRIAIPERLLTYGLGMSLWNLIKHPLEAGGSTTYAR